MTMKIEPFGLQLLNSLDLDPIYVMLHRSKCANLMEPDQLRKWCVIYWCTYHAGVASFGSEQRDTFKFLEDVAGNVTRRWPRGTERRHFRGTNAERLVEYLSSVYEDAEDFVKEVTNLPHTFESISKRVQKNTGFGPWIAFKMADMAERVLDVPVDFKNCELSFYKDPVEGAQIAYQAWGVADWAFEKFPGKNDKEKRLNYAINRLMETLGDHTAPPSNNRFIGLQEIETILCKWKSHVKGHYPVGKDTREIRHALSGFGSLADKLAELLPQGDM